MKNAFYFILKARLFSGNLNFCPGVSGMKKSGFKKKINFKFMTSQTEQQIINYIYFPISQAAKAIRQ